MTGFDKKVVHVAVHGHNVEKVSVTIQVDVTGIAGHMGESWFNYTAVELSPTNPYVYHVFPDGYSAHWVRVVSDQSCQLTTYFHYT